VDRTTLEAVAELLDREAAAQRHAANKLRHAPDVGVKAPLSPDRGEFDPVVVRSTRLILSDFCRDLARDLRSLA
jgi:hypothetical protein